LREEGFETSNGSFALPGFGPGPVTRIYGGAEMTVSGAGVTLESHANVKSPLKFPFVLRIQFLYEERGIHRGPRLQFHKADRSSNITKGKNIVGRHVQDCVT